MSAPPAPGATASTAPVADARVSVAPVMGAPDHLSTALTDGLADALSRQGVPAAKGKDAAVDHVIRGYFVAAKDQAGTKLSYIWDITDRAGSKRLNRIQGEEVIKGGTGTDPWTAIDAKAVQGVAERSAAKIIPSLPASARAPAVASAAPAALAQKTALATPPAAPTRAVAAPQTTASIGRAGDATTFVPTVIGAPGDGSTALAAALRRELERKSVPLASGPAGNTYKVQGRVAVSQAGEGKQAVQIEWIVTDPAGKKLGTVSQKNTIPKGSLDGTWGQTADMAAEGAAQGILKLLPTRSANN